MNRRNITILAISQALGQSAIPAISLIGGIIGTTLAPTPALATLPISLIIIGVALFTIPAAMTMKRIGRRYGFIASAAGAALTCLLAAYAIQEDSFLLFCLAMLLIGGNAAFTQQYRFAAAESAPPDQVGRAVSYVLVGGIAAGFLGPEIVKRTQAGAMEGMYTSTFVVLSGLYVVVILLMLFLQEGVSRQDNVSGEERALRAIISQPVFITALASGVVANGVMTFIMTATPVNMHVMHGFNLDETAWVIQSHVIAMYLPSLFTGFLLQRLGLLRLMGAGLAAMLVCVALAWSGQDLMHYWGALVLLGVGWNFLYVSGTTLLTRTYRPSEQYKTQATNDFTVFGIQAVASLSAGAVLFTTGWDILVLLTLPFLLALVVGLFYLRSYLAPPPVPVPVSEPGSLD